MTSLLSRIPRIRTRTLKLLIPACGLVGLIFRLLISVTGIDGKGLIVPNHPAWICLCLVTIAAAGILLAGVLPIRGPASHRGSFPPSPIAALGCAPAAVSALIGAVTHFRTGAVESASPLAPVLFILQGTLIFLAAAGFVLVALCRLLGKKPLFLCHVAICIWFALQMLTLYQTWSFDPQVQKYCFQLFACIALAMTAYQQACFDMGRGSHRKLWAWSLTAVYLCCLSAASGLFFITGGIWAAANLSNLRRPRRSAETEMPANTD